MAHGHGHCGIGTLLGVHPQVGQFGDFGVIGRNRHGLGTLVAHLGEEVGVRCTRLRHIGTPGDDEVGVVPVGRLGHVGLLTPHLRAGRRQIAIPVIEAQADTTDQRQVAATGRIADHGHGGNRREAHHAVGTVFLGGVDVGAGDQLVDFLPGAAYKATQTALLLPFATGCGVFHNIRPGVNRTLGHGQRCTPVLQQATTHHRVLDAVGAVKVPGVGRTARAATGLVVGQVVAGAGVVGLLGFPGDDAALDVDLPRAGARAVHAVGGTHDLVVRPAIAVGVFPGTVFTGGDSVPIGERLFGRGKVGESIEKVAHKMTSVDEF